MHVLLQAFLLSSGSLGHGLCVAIEPGGCWKETRVVLAYVEHGGIHFFAAALLLGLAVPGLWTNPGFYGVLVALTFLHLGIDWSKVRLGRVSKVGDGAALFFGDQAVHFVTVSIAAWLVVRPSVATLMAQVRWFQSETEKPLLLLVVYVGVIFGGGHVVRFLTKPLPKSNMEIIGESTSQLENAGMYIGWLERFVVLTSLVLQSPATVGLILTAKSIARYPELKSVRFAEYFLIGTLLSVTLGILGGLVLLKAFYGTVTLGK